VKEASITESGLNPECLIEIRTCRLNAGCATQSWAAALLKFDASPTARKYPRCRSSIITFHYTETA
jgi:hypothetical protein